MSHTPFRVDSPAEFQVRVVTRFDEPGLGAEAWNKLAALSDTNTVFQSYEWMTSWWKVFGTGRELLLIAVFRNNDLVGLAPLMHESSRSGASKLAFVGASNADYCDFLLAEPRETVLRSIMATLSTQRDRWRELRLSNLPEQSFTARTLPALCNELKLSPLPDRRVECPALVFGSRDTAERTLRKRQSLKRPWNHFCRVGRVDFAESQTPDEIRDHLEHFFEQHIRRWKGTSTPSLFTNPRNREFYRELAFALLPTGKLAFSRVTLDGRPLAYHFGFVHNRSYIWYKPSFDIDYQQQSPGTLLLRLLLLRALERDCQEFDFTIGNESFKYRYSNVTRYNVQFWVFSHRSTYLLQRLRMRAKAWLKQMKRR